jgi:uncharacterized protein YecT (DUF1311 family)
MQVFNLPIGCRRALMLALVILALVAKAAPARADDLDGWCAQAKKASSIVICSDSELRRQAMARNKFFEAAREKLDPDAYKTLSEDQTRWVKMYTASCGIGVDDPVPSLPISPPVLECYRQESRARTAYLAARLGLRTEPPTSSSSAAQNRLTPPPNPSEAAIGAWYQCLYEAADALASQPEFARTVVDASFGSCTKQEIAYKDTISDLGWNFVEHIKTNIVGPKVLARVMIIRAAREKLRKPEQPSPAPAIDYNKM